MWMKNKLVLGDRKFIVPELRLEDIREHCQAAFDLIRSDERDRGKIGIAMVTLLHTALRRNYPELTPEEVAEIVDMRNIHEFADAIIGNSGLSPADRGEAVSANSTGTHRAA
jgi:hypothetical protein